MRRFMVGDLGPGRIVVVGPQAHHALHVLRLGMGDRVCLMDGRGGLAEGVIVEVGADAFAVDVAVRSEVAGKEAGSLLLAVAPPKGPRGDWLVEKCAELGVARLVALETARGEVRPSEAKLDRWRRKAIEAAKQARQGRVMEIGDMMSITAALDAVAETEFRGYADPKRGTRGLLLLLGEHQAMAGGLRSGALFIGPEGGFTEGERDLFERRSIAAFSLGGAILRIETAALAAAAIWAACGATARGPEPTP